MKQFACFCSFIIMLLLSAPTLFAQSTISSTDGSVKVETERVTNDEIIWFHTDGLDRARFTGTRLEFLNTGNSIFMGDNAGRYDDLSNNQNIFIGEFVGSENITGDNNVGLGRFALRKNVAGRFNMALGGNALFNTTASYNVAVGGSALFSNTTGQNNIAIGFNALRFATTAFKNTAIGSEALRNAGTGGDNLAMGFRAGFNIGDGAGNVFLGNETGYNNSGNGSIFIGDGAGYNEPNSNRLVIENSTATNPLIYGEFDNDVVRINGRFDVLERIQVLNTNENTFVGEGVGAVTTTGTRNTAVGNLALRDNTSGAENTAIGHDAMILNTEGIANTAVGSKSLAQNIDGRNNTAVGVSAMAANATGWENTAIGFFTLKENTSGGRNAALGQGALQANTTGNRNTALGFDALFNNLTGSDNVAIGHQAGFYETGSNKLYIENSNDSLPLIYGEFDNDLLTVNGALGVGANASGAKIYAVDSTTSSSQAVIYALNDDTGSTDRRAVRGTSTPTDGYGVGGEFRGGWKGIYSIANGGDYSGSVYGVQGYAYGGTAGNRYAVYGSAAGGAEAWGGYFPTKVYATELRVGGTSGATGYKLAIDGKAICEELKIQNSGSWPDYVFAAEYDLKPLEEVEAFIQENKHLPNIPSEREIADADGFHIGEMQNKTIEKVEELTLYAIDANKRIKELEATNAELAKQNAEMKAMMESILKKLEK